MSASTAIFGQPAPTGRYKLGQPIMRREQRIAFERIHRAVAQQWSDSMAEYLPDGAALEFDGMDFDTFSSVAMDESSCTQIMLFSITATPISGFFVMSGALATFLVSGRLGLKSASEDKANAPLTRIETAIACETIRAMLSRLGGAYATAGLGSIGDVRECDDLADSFLFAPEEHLALLKFHISAMGKELPLLIGLSANVIAAMSALRPALAAKRDNRDTIVNAVRQLPIEVEVVLGSWKVSIDEMLQLRAGDKIILPDGEDSWLKSRGVRIRRASVEVSASGASVEIRRSARLR
jgi:flagellar motor switch protein FliM